MNVELLKIYLDEWTRRSNKYKGGPKGYPSKSIGFVSGGYQSSLDDFEADMDRQIIAALDTIIYIDLPETQRIAVLMATGQIPKVFKSNRMGMEELLEMAFRGIWQGLVNRNLA